MMKIKPKNYIIYLICSLVFWGGMSLITYIVFFENVQDIVEPHYPTQGIMHASEILIHNSKNLFLTILGFLFSPIIIVVNNILLIVTIANNAGFFGWKDTIMLLLPHGIIEIPTILTYQYLSLYMLFISAKYKSLSYIKKFFLENFQWFLYSYFGVLISAFIEGIIG